MSTRHLASCVCAYFFINFSGGLPISSDPSRSIFIHSIHIFRARQPPFLTSITSIFGHNVDRIHVYYIYILYISYILYICVCISLVLFDPWSVSGFLHTQFMKIWPLFSICPKDADSLRYIYLSWLLNGFLQRCASAWHSLESVGSYSIDCWAPCFHCCSSWTSHCQWLVNSISDDYIFVGYPQAFLAVRVIIPFIRSRMTDDPDCWVNTILTSIPLNYSS